MLSSNFPQLLPTFHLFYIVHIWFISSHIKRIRRLPVLAETEIVFFAEPIILRRRFCAREEPRGYYRFRRARLFGLFPSNGFLYNNKFRAARKSPSRSVKCEHANFVLSLTVVGDSLRRQRDNVIFSRRLCARDREWVPFSPSSDAINTRTCAGNQRLVPEMSAI